MRHISADPRAEADEVDTAGAPAFVRMVGPSRVSISFVMVRGKYFFSCVMQVQAADLKQCCKGKAVRPSDEVASGEVAETAPMTHEGRTLITFSMSAYQLISARPPYHVHCHQLLSVKGGAHYCTLIEHEDHDGDYYVGRFYV